MKILQIVNMASPYPGNLIASLNKLEDTINKEGDVCVYLFPKAAEERYWIKEKQRQGKKIYFKSQNKLKNILMIPYICKKEKINLIHLHFWSLADCAGIKLAKVGAGKVKSVVHHHSMYAISRKVWKEKIKQWFFGNTEHIACSKGIEEKLTEAGFDRTKIQRVDNCIDFSRLDNREELQFEENSFLLFSGCGVEIKGTDIACLAVQKLRNKGEDINLVIVSSEKEDEIREYLEKLLGSKPDWLHFLKPRNDIATYYHAARCFLSTSRSEGLCYSVIEAAYCGCEPIQSEIPGHCLDLPMCKTFQSENVEQLEKKMKELLCEDGDEKEYINKIQKEYVQSVYGIEHWVQGVMEVYATIRRKD